MLNLLGAELFKIKKSFSIKALFGVSIICAAAMAVLEYLIDQGSVDTSISGIVFLFSDMNMISILGGITASILICGDIDSKVIGDAISSGYGRGKVVISKAITYFIIIVFLLLPYSIITGIALSTGETFDLGTLGLGFANILVQDSGFILSVSSVFQLILVMLILIIVYMAQLSICLPIAFIIRKPVLMIAIYYMWSAFCGQLMGLSKRFQILDKIMTATPYGVKYSVITLNTSKEDLIQAMLISGVFISIMIMAAYLIFRKKELK